MRAIDSKTVGISPKTPQPMITPTDDFADFASFDVPKNPVTVEVKPFLPKIRLDLCPVPREEDEEEDSSVSVADAKQKRNSKHKNRRSSRRR